MARPDFRGNVEPGFNERREAVSYSDRSREIHSRPGSSSRPEVHERSGGSVTGPSGPVKESLRGELAESEAKDQDDIATSDIAISFAEPEDEEKIIEERRKRRLDILQKYAQTERPATPSAAESEGQNEGKPFQASCFILPRLLYVYSCHTTAICRGFCQGWRG
jgi:hypothetical protein